MLVRVLIDDNQGCCLLTCNCNSWVAVYNQMYDKPSAFFSPAKNLQTFWFLVNGKERRSNRGRVAPILPRETSVACVVGGEIHQST